MLANEQMRYGARIMAAMFGGPGIFYICESFVRPADAVTGFIYLVIATALVLTAADKGERTPPARRQARRGRALLALLRPRR